MGDVTDGDKPKPKGHLDYEKTERKRAENRARWQLLQDWDLKATRRAKERKKLEEAMDAYLEVLLADADEGTLFYDLDEDIFERRRSQA